MTRGWSLSFHSQDLGTMPYFSTPGLDQMMLFVHHRIGETAKNRIERVAGMFENI
jgi:hypothetical protein